MRIAVVMAILLFGSTARAQEVGIRQELGPEVRIVLTATSSILLAGGLGYAAFQGCDASTGSQSGERDSCFWSGFYGGGGLGLGVGTLATGELLGGRGSWYWTLIGQALGVGMSFPFWLRREPGGLAMMVVLPWLGALLGYALSDNPGRPIESDE